MIRAFRSLLTAEIDAVEMCDCRTVSSRGRKILITCEHASNRLPEPYHWTQGDERFKDTHWAYDPGAADTAKLLAQRLGTVAVLSRFTRLLLDPNRTLFSETLFRKACEGHSLDLNSSLSPEEKYTRISRFHAPYHFLIGELAEFLDPDLAVSIHTFTPNYEGQQRSVEIGVLYEDWDESLALHTQNLFRTAGFDARLNEPWSGKEGLMPVGTGLRYAKGGKRRDVIELEIRNDLATDAVMREKVVGVILQMTQRYLESSPSAEGSH